MRSSRSDDSSRLPWRKNKSSRPKKRRFFGRRARRDEAEQRYARSAHDSERYEDEYDDTERYDDHYEDERDSELGARGGRARRVDARHRQRYEEDAYEDDRHVDDAYEDSDYDDSSYEEAEPRPRRRKKKRFSLSNRKTKRGKKRRAKSAGSRFKSLSNRTKYIMYAAGGLVLLVLFLPSIIGMTMGGSFLVSALSDVNGIVHVGGASMGWFSGTTFYDVEIRDRGGETVFKAPEFSSDKTALSLYMDSSDLGQLQVARPQAFVHFDEEGSNLEQVLSAWLEGPSSLDAPKFELKVLGGTVELEDRRASSKWQFQDAEVSVTMSRNWSDALKLRAVAKMPQPDGTTDFDLQLTLNRRGGANGAVLQDGQAEIETADFPLAAFQPIARRLAPDANVQGIATLRAALAWGNIDTPGWNMSIDGLMEARDLRVSAPELGGDEIYFRTAALPINMSYVDETLTIERLASITDVGRVDLTGKVVIDTHDGVTAGLTQALADQAYEFEGNIDLAKLAAILPRTMHLRDGLQVTQGDVRWKVSHAGRAGDGTWSANLETSQLRARHGEEVIAWDDPIQLEFAAKETNKGIQIETLRCYSDFIKLDAMGDLNQSDAEAGLVDQFDIAAEFELEPLSRELNRFVDFGQTNFGGGGWAYVTWRRRPNGKFETTWELDVRQFEVAIEGHAPWREDRLIIQAQANGQLQNSEVTNLDVGKVEFRSGIDTVQVEIIEQVRRPTMRSQWPLHVTVRGTTTSWLDRAQMWIESASRWNGRTEGDLDIEAAVVVSPRQITVESGTQVRVSDFVLETRNWKVAEPSVEAVLAAAWDPETDVIDVASMRVTTPTGEMTARDVRLHWPAGGAPNIAGVVNVTGDLTKVQAWRRIPAKHGVSGQLIGELKITNNNGATVGQWNGRIDNFSLQTGESATWSERLVSTSATAQYDRRNDRLQILRAIWESNALTCDAAGDITRLRTERELTLGGNIAYDPQKLVGLLRPYFGDAVRVNATRQPHPFRLHGVLTPSTSSFETQLTGSFITRADGEAQMSWTSADIYGFRLGAGELRFDLANGLILMRPLDMPVNGGQLSLAAQLDMLEDQPRLQIEPGRVLNNVTLTPDIARFGSMKYIVPWINGVTAAQGTFSLDVDGAHVPIETPVHAEAAGKLIVHDIAFAPGPLLRQVGFWADLVRQLAGKPTQTSQLQTVRLLNESTVRYRVVDQRVYHDELVLVFEDMTINTRGWVGFDQSQAILARIEAPDLFNKIPGGSVLVQNGLEVPIAGTISRPQLDIARVQQQLGGTAQSLLQRAAASGNRMLADELEKQLRKLLAPIR
ncbi:MAG: DUF748 domain-containing protein [Pirellulales bacterium]|nr:DUF748 domain-containing protein [Pirellulales bacterium]